MDADIIRRDLELAERHVFEGAARLQRQREIVVQLRRDGHDTAMAAELLNQLEKTQRLFVEDWKRISELLILAIKIDSAA